MSELFIFLIPLVMAIYLIVNQQLEKYRKRIAFLEVKVDALIKHTEIKFDDASMLPVEVNNAIKSGHRLKAIRLYRKITGAGLKDASDVIDKLIKNTV